MHSRSLEVAPGGDGVPAPWNFSVRDVHRHHNEIVDQVIAITLEWADRCEWDPGL